METVFTTFCDLLELNHHGIEHCCHHQNPETCFKWNYWFEILFLPAHVAVIVLGILYFGPESCPVSPDLSTWLIITGTIILVQIVGTFLIAIPFVKYCWQASNNTGRVVIGLWFTITRFVCVIYGFVQVANLGNDISTADITSPKYCHPVPYITSSIYFTCMIVLSVCWIGLCCISCCQNGCNLPEEVDNAPTSTGDNQASQDGDHDNVDDETSPLIPTTTSLTINSAA